MIGTGAAPGVRRTVSEITAATRHSADPPTQAPDASAVAGLVGLILIPTFAGQLLLFRILRLHGSRKLSIVTYLTTGIFLHFAFIRYFWLIMALAASVIYIAEQRALAEPQTDKDELALVPAAAEGSPVPVGPRVY